VQYQQRSNGGWEIVEADIYLNADNFDWSGNLTNSQDVGAVVRERAKARESEQPGLIG